MGSITNILTKINLRLFPRLVNSRMAIDLYRSRGIEIGKGTFIFNAGSVTIDTSRPNLLKIGEFCKITGGVIILTHDYSRSVLRRVYGEVIGEARQTIIGNNVFIGMNSILLMGTKIGDNCIVGAGSVLNGTYQKNSVIAGNPAKVICTLDDYYRKRKERYIREAFEFVNTFFDKNNRDPRIEEMGSFFPIFLSRTETSLKKYNIRTRLSGDEEDEVLKFFFESEPVFESYKEFLNKAKSNI